MFWPTGAVTKHGGPGDHTGGDTGDGVFDHGAACGLHTQRGGGGQVHIGEGFGAGRFVAAENAPGKVRREADFFYLQLDLDTVGTRGTGNLPAERGVYRLHGGVDVGDGLQLALQQRVALGAELLHPFLGEGLAGALFDQVLLILDSVAEKCLHTFGLGQGPATGVQHAVQHAVGEGLGVHQHTVAVEQDGVKRNGHWLLLNE